MPFEFYPSFQIFVFLLMIRIGFSSETGLSTFRQDQLNND